MTRPQVDRGPGKKESNLARPVIEIPAHNRLTIHRRSGLSTSLLAVKASTTDCLREKKA
jgi:hypothetical protein